MVETELYEMYLEEIKQIPACTPEENFRLLEELAAGNQEVRNRLAEGNLQVALSVIDGYGNPGISKNDFIQEANMALLLAIDDYGRDNQESSFEVYLQEKVKQALDDTLEEQRREAKAEEEILARVNVLKEVSQRMAESLGREATIEELAGKMKMSEEEIRDIMKTTLDALSVTGE